MPAAAPLADGAPVYGQDRRLGADSEMLGRAVGKLCGLELSLVGSDEPRFAEDVAGHGRFNGPVAGQACQRDRLVHGE